MEKNLIQRVYHGCCLEIMKEIPDGSVDLIISDLPYEVTARNEWDVLIPFEPLWEQYKRITKKNAAIVLTAITPFSAKLAMSNIKDFKYEWTWIKNRPVNFLNAKKQPLRKSEKVLVFYRQQCVYNPQGLIHKPRMNKRSKTGSNYNDTGGVNENFSEFTNYPTDILNFDMDKNATHPTQKPVALMEYLIKTYSNEGDLVLDSCSGSGTTLLAAKNLNRQFIGIEKNKEFYESCLERIK